MKKQTFHCNGCGVEITVSVDSSSEFKSTLLEQGWVHEVDTNYCPDCLAEMAGIPDGN